MTSCKNDPFGDFNESITYEEVANVCSKLKLGVSGVLIDYEHVPFCWTSTVELVVRALK